MKQWLIETIVKKFGPSAIRAGIVALLTWATAYSGVLEQYGVVIDKVAHTATIHFDTLGAAILVLVMMILGGSVKVANTEVKKVLPEKSAAPESTPPIG
jgi:hypothetical protein